MSYLEKIESAVIDIDVDLSSLDEEELYETLWDFDIENEIKLSARKLSDNRPNITVDVLAVIAKIRQQERITSMNI